MLAVEQDFDDRVCGFHQAGQLEAVGIIFDGVPKLGFVKPVSLCLVGPTPQYSPTIQKGASSTLRVGFLALNSARAFRA